MIFRKINKSCGLSVFSKTSYRLQEKENNVILKRSAILLPTVTHSELRVGSRTVARKEWNRRRCHHWWSAAGDTAGTSPSCWKANLFQRKDWREGRKPRPAQGRAGDTGGRRTPPCGASPKGLDRVLSPHPAAEAEFVKLGLC